MPDTAITLNLSQPTDILLNLTTQRTFDCIVFIEMIGDTADFVFSQLTSTGPIP
jgi:hypothetical protein